MRSKAKAHGQLSKIFCMILFLFLSYGIGFSEQGKVKIVFCDDYYCTQMPTGEEYKIVKQVDWAANKVTLSPDDKYVAYTTSNGLGFENEGRDVFYCMVDGSERTFLHKFQTRMDTLIWISSEGTDFICAASWDCALGIGVIDLKSKALILKFRGNRLQKIQGTDCYQVYCQDKPVEQDRQKICLEELETIKEPDSFNVRFLQGWSNWDVYVSTQRDQVLTFNEVSKSTREQDKALMGIMWSEPFAHSKIIPNQKNDRIVFFANDSTSGFFGVVDIQNKKLLSFDKTDSSKFSNATWSPDGANLAIVRMSNSQTYIDFYKVNQREKVNLIRTKSLPGDGQVIDFKWPSHSNTIYFSYVSPGSRRVPYIIDVEDK
jgi:hypothetical protein